MDKVINDLNNSENQTKEVLEKIKITKERSEEKAQIVNNIYTDGGNITVDTLNQVVDNKDAETKLLRNVIDDLEGVVDLKDKDIDLLKLAVKNYQIEVDNLRQQIEDLREQVQDLRKEIAEKK